MNDPFATKRRRYIPWSEYRALEADQSIISLIGRTKIHHNEIEHRLSVLQQYETLLGFVYFGERKWLENRLSVDNGMSYAAWVADQLSVTIFTDGFTPTIDTISGNCWKGYTE